ncbi:MAG TPA: anion permease [Candidatus Lachnoclostridium pullistercoris]|uniref:Anion permease n=1 Tax=Candidatus Lachnoclostridium pullistercoris TaxID=2838632 RepID=A0A9D2PD18_9FIRM|nr:anion permease [Candidatus Lachnoclostridium pullistercoris]
MEMYIVIALFAFMIISFCIGKWPFGLTAMSCCILLVLTGVMTIEEAFSGFAMKNFVLVAGMYVLCDAFGKTRLLTAIRQRVMQLEKKSNVILLLILMFLIMIFAQFLPSSGTITVMIMILSALSPEGDLCPSRMMLPMAIMGGMWTSRLPVGMGATSHLLPNQYISSYGADLPLLTITDTIKVSIIPMILLSLYVILTYKMLPKRSVDQSKLKSVKDKEGMSRFHETVTYVVFVGVLASLFMNSLLGDIMYIIPAAGAAVLMFTKVESQKEMQRVLSGDMLFMLAGIFVMGDALSASGAGVMLGDFILGLMGENPSGLTVLIVFAIVGVVMTNFMSNSGTKNVLLPMGVATAVAAGWDPRGICLLIQTVCSCAVFLPSGAPSTAIAFAAAEYKLQETFLWSLGYAVLTVLSFVVSINFFFPVV